VQSLSDLADSIPQDRSAGERSRSALQKKIQDVQNSIIELSSLVEDLKEEYLDKMREIVPDIDVDLARMFLREPYAILQRNDNSYFIVVPRWVNFTIGWLERVTDSYNIFVVDKYTAWLGEVPAELTDKLNLKQPEQISVLDHVLQFDPSIQSKIRRRYSKYLNKIGEGFAHIRPSKEFDLLARIIDNGSLPFLPQPVSLDDRREPQVRFSFDGRYSFQKEAFVRFLEKGAIGVYWMMGAGKSFLAMYALDSLEGAKLIVVPTKTLKDQWLEYLRNYAPRLVNETDIITYNSFHRIRRKEFICTIYDECHRLPANTYSRLATIRTKYRIGLSASPYREDGRHSYIFALTGFPIGMDWSALMAILGKEYHDVHLHLVKNQRLKFRKASELLMPGEKTIIFCDSIDMGKKLSARLDIPFVFGETEDRLDVVRTNRQIIASRVLDLGLSDKELQHIIEIDFLYGSRQQELQRTGRLLHSTKGRHDIIMAEGEYLAYRKRLYALVEKGFKISVDVDRRS
jgi:DNA excision repair protein ERCC-3